MVRLSFLCCEIFVETYFRPLWFSDLIALCNLLLGFVFFLKKISRDFNFSTSQTHDSISPAGGANQRIAASV